VEWISLGGDSVISENVRDEQRKFIKYNHLVANILAFHNIVSMTKAIDHLKAQGQQISDDVLAAVSPYQNFTYQPIRPVPTAFPAGTGTTAVRSETAASRNGCRRTGRPGCRSRTLRPE
jgi:hypothetical protein